MQHDSERHVDEILSRIEGTRSEMDRTLAAIERKLSREQLLDQGLNYIRDSGAAQFAQNLGGAARQNPLPVVLTGIGIAWLMALGREPARGDVDDVGFDDADFESVDDDSGDGDGGIRERLGDVSERVAGVKERAEGRLRSIGHRAGGTVHSIADMTRERWDRARGGVRYLAHDHPLILGAIGLAVGAALGASAPRTRREEQLLGDASRRMTEKVKEASSEQLDKAKEAVRRTTESALESKETH
jgi:hypothetical protein